MKRASRRRPPRTVQGTAGDILAFLAAHGTHDKDAAAPAPRRPAARPVIEKRKGGALRMTLDLHGLRMDEASRRLRLTMETCRARGIRELRIIHGLGRHSVPAGASVLKGFVREMLGAELALSVRDFRNGLPREGGEGVTVAYLV